MSLTKNFSPTIYLLNKLYIRNLKPTSFKHFYFYYYYSISNDAKLRKLVTIIIAIKQPKIELKLNLN